MNGTKINERPLKVDWAFKTGPITDSRKWWSPSLFLFCKIYWLYLSIIIHANCQLLIASKRPKSIPSLYPV